MANVKSGTDRQHKRTRGVSKSMTFSSLLGDSELAAAVLDGLLDGIVLVGMDGRSGLC